MLSFGRAPGAAQMLTDVVAPAFERILLRRALGLFRHREIAIRIYQTFARRRRQSRRSVFIQQHSGRHSGPIADDSRQYRYPSRDDRQSTSHRLDHDFGEAFGVRWEAEDIGLSHQVQDRGVINAPMKNDSTVQTKIFSQSLEFRQRRTVADNVEFQSWEIVVQERERPATPFPCLCLSPAGRR